MIEENYRKIIESIEKFKKEKGIYRKIRVVAVTKSQPVDSIVKAVEAGILDIGENYVQELKSKREEFLLTGLPEPRWHFIGHLQTNKVKYIVPFVHLIHSVDSVHLADEIDKQAKKVNRQIDILIQVNTSGERSKFGCRPEELLPIVEQISMLQNINIIGLMTIGSFSDDEKIIRSEFKLLRKLFEQVRQKFPNLPIRELSMGMTNDYLIAIEEGATIVRIGTAIFGPRK